VKQSRRLIHLVISDSKASVWIHQMCFVWKDCRIWKHIL
jgi:hypothetical protein